MSGRVDQQRSAQVDNGPGLVARLGERLFRPMLDRIDRGLAAGAIEVTLPDGSWRRLGGRQAGPVATVRIVRWRALAKLASGGSVGWYKAWAAGDWSSPDPVPLFDLFMRNRRSLGDVGRSGGPAKLAARTVHWLRRNTPSGSRANIEAHYDLGNDFYELWLDPTLTYSSALFAEPISNAEPLAAAQARKLDAILDRTRLQAGQCLLEIGCGWGSLAEAAARRGIRVHGITLSSEQKRAVEERMFRAGLDGVSVALTDYRDETGQYDAVASIEMVEAVGQEFWPVYLDSIARSLKPGGRAALQFISIDDAIFRSYSDHVDFIQRYIFPGGMLVSESGFRALAEQRGLRWCDRQGFALHYAETLRRWRECFDDEVEQGRLPSRLDNRFVAMWRYYLMYCEGGFRGGGIDVAQVTLVKR